MKKTRSLLKICGVTEQHAVDHCVASGIDYVGFNFYPKSKRYIEPKVARDLWLKGQPRAPSGQHTQAVAVVVDPSPIELRQWLEDFPELCALQFHGRETPQAIRGFRSALEPSFRRPGSPLALWKAIGVKVPQDIDQATPFQDEVDLILFDSAPVGSDLGGTGRSFPAAWLERYRRVVPFGVAGGIKPGGLGAEHGGILSLRPDLIDVCSGVEKSAGIKDLAAIDRLWAEVCA